MYDFDATTAHAKNQILLKTAKNKFVSNEKNVKTTHIMVTKLTLIGEFFAFFSLTITRLASLMEEMLEGNMSCFLGDTSGSSSDDNTASKA